MSDRDRLKKATLLYAKQESSDLLVAVVVVLYTLLWAPSVVYHLLGDFEVEVQVDNGISVASIIPTYSHQLLQFLLRFFSSYQFMSCPITLITDNRH